MHLPRCVVLFKIQVLSTLDTSNPLTSLRLIPATLHPASAVASPCSRRRACPLVYATARYSEVVVMQVCLIDGAGQLSLSRVPRRPRTRAPEAISRGSGARTCTTCICWRRTSVAESSPGRCGRALESVQRAPAKASSGSPQHHCSCLSSLYRNTMLFDKLLP